MMGFVDSAQETRNPKRLTIGPICRTLAMVIVGMIALILVSKVD